MKKLIEYIQGIIGFVLVLHVPLGGYTWCVVAFDGGSFFMFWCVIFMPVSIPLGIYMLYFGTPEWLINLFGLTF